MPSGETSCRASHARRAARSRIATCTMTQMVRTWREGARSCRDGKSAAAVGRESREVSISVWTDTMAMAHDRRANGVHRNRDGSISDGLHESDNALYISEIVGHA